MLLWNIEIAVKMTESVGKIWRLVGFDEINIVVATKIDAIDNTKLLDKCHNNTNTENICK